IPLVRRRLFLTTFDLIGGLLQRSRGYGSVDSSQGNLIEILTQWRLTKLLLHLPLLRQKGKASRNLTVKCGRKLHINLLRYEQRAKELPASSMKKAPKFSENPVSSMKRAPSFMEKPVLSMERLPATAQLQLNNMDGKRKDNIDESHVEQPSKRPEISLAKPDGTINPAIPPSKPSKRTGNIGESAADAWERVELEKLKDNTCRRYEKEEEQIVSWESEKKEKAKHRLDKTEREPERTRLKALERFQSDMDTVTQIAEAARAKIARKQKKEELRVKEKADIYRSTGQIPRSTCFCF
ncbi:unnamed protein product, partial [Linum tenue]